MADTMIVLRNRYTNNVRLASRITPYLIHNGWHIDQPLTLHYSEGRKNIGTQETNPSKNDNGNAVYGD